MRVGLGLPTAVPDADQADIASIAALAESAGFDSLGVVDRLAYHTIDPLVALASAAAATTRIELTTSVLLAPLRQPRLLAKEVAALKHVSGGRFILGLGVGNRREDYAAADRPFARRGALLDETIRVLTGRASGEAPTTWSAPTIAIDRLRLGGGTDAALERVARLGCAWMYGGPDAAGFDEASGLLTRHWRDHGRRDLPVRSALAFVSLGDDAEAAADRHIGTYYEYAPFRQHLRDQVATTADAVRTKVDQYRDLGCTELILFPCTSNPVEVERLATALGLA